MKRTGIVFSLGVAVAVCGAAFAEPAGTARAWNFSGAEQEIGATRNLDASPAPNAPFSFEISLCPRSCPGARGEGMVASWGNGYNNGWRLVLSPAHGAYRVHMSLGHADGLRSGARWVGALRTNEWTTLAVTFDGRELRLYRDGAWNAVAVATNGFVRANPASLALGGARHGISFFPFAASRVAADTRAWSAEEVAARFAASVPESDWSPVFRRRMADADFAAGRFAAACSRYASLYAAATSTPSRAEIALVYAAALDKAGRAGAARDVRRGISSSGDLPRYLTDEAARGTPPPSPPPPDFSPRAGARLPDTNLVRIPVRETRTLGPADSGTPASPRVIRSRPGETDILDGAREVPRWRDPTPEETARLPPAARGHVRVADLASQGFPAFPPLEPYGYGLRGGKMADLTADGRLLTPARHPNAHPDGGFARAVEADGRTFRTDLVLPDSWAAETNAFATGYWWNFWSDRTVPVSSISASSGAIALAEDVPRLRVRKGAAFYLCNALSALDSPGEWFLDRASSTLFAWPERPGARWTLTFLDGPILKLERVSDVVIENLVFEGSSGTALVLANVTNVTVRNCVFRNCSRGGISASGRNVTVENCTFHGLGRGAVGLSGGSRRTLEPAGHRVAGCEAFDLGRHWRTYTPAVSMNGCGADIVGNHFHDLLTSAFRIDANDVRVVSNRLSRCVLESDDQGAFDIYANPTFAGVEIAFNLWEDIGAAGAIAPTGKAAVRLDDIISGVVIRHNRFVRCGRGHFGAVQINGGRRNFVDGNVFDSCPLDVSIQGRTDAYWSKALGKHRAAFESPAYLSRYPGFGALPSAPPANYIWRNTLIDVRRSATSREGAGNKTLLH